ncbi:arginine/serine-rich coiled-coil protein 2-like [Belonocnema kinseyi]|uniref:arginine/serine-rich coiled-coil protein 2-like n=1 Tax=Belonocnema kinseyi TaxID=2817044 RepID=UPI00143D33CB|nr:arginine/serine-rich coiled-coil protein 2-like [Belonocnema kinseyi]
MGRDSVKRVHSADRRSKRSRGHDPQKYSVVKSYRKRTRAERSLLSRHRSRSREARKYPGNEIGGERSPRGSSRHGCHCPTKIYQKSREHRSRKSRYDKHGGERHTRGAQRHSRHRSRTSLRERPRRYSTYSSYNASSSSSYTSGKTSQGRGGSLLNTRARKHNQAHSRRERCSYSFTSEERERSQSQSAPPEIMDRKEGDTALPPEAMNLLAGVKTVVSGPQIHTSLAEMWTKILKSGLLKEERKELQEKYPTTVNCPMLQAPILNLEVKSIDSMAMKKDNYQVSAQPQLSTGVEAIGLCLTEILKKEKELTDEPSLNLSHLLRLLGDSGRLLTHMHYRMSCTKPILIIE